MGIVVHQLAIDDRSDFVNPVREQEATIKYRYLCVGFRYVASVDIGNAGHGIFLIFVFVGLGRRHKFIEIAQQEGGEHKGHVNDRQPHQLRVCKFVGIQKYLQQMNG